MSRTVTNNGRGSANCLLAMILAMMWSGISLAPAAAPDSKQTKVVPRSFYAVLEGIVTYVPTPGTPWGVITLVETTGVCSHLGVAAYSTTHTPAPGLILDGSGTLTAANGDVITVEYGGTSEAPEVDPGTVILSEGEVVVTGGTGRFAHAKGILHSTGFVTWLGFEFMYSPVIIILEGTISY